MSAELAPLLPEILLLLGAVAALLAGSFLPRERQWVARIIAVTALVAAGVATGVGLAGSDSAVFDGTFAADVSTGVARAIVIGATLLVISMGTEELSGQTRESETYALLLLGALGAIVVAGADDLLVLVAGFLLASIPLYALVGMSRTAAGAEAAMKTYLLGALLGILLLAGVTLLSAVAGSSRYVDMADGLGGVAGGLVAVGGVLVVGGLMFKAGGVPGHFWVPDAAQGAGGTAAAFVTTVPKIGALVAVYRIVDALPDDARLRLLTAVIAALSMTLGKPRRVLPAGPAPAAGLVDGQPGRVPAGARGRRRAQRTRTAVAAGLPGRVRGQQRHRVRGHDGAAQAPVAGRLRGLLPRARGWRRRC